MDLRSFRPCARSGSRPEPADAGTPRIAACSNLRLLLGGRSRKPRLSIRPVRQRGHSRPNCDAAGERRSYHKDYTHRSYGVFSPHTMSGESVFFETGRRMHPCGVTSRRRAASTDLRFPRYVRYSPTALGCSRCSCVSAAPSLASVAISRSSRAISAVRAARHDAICLSVCGAHGGRCRSGSPSSW